jgi:hypothetical protein
MKPIYVIQLNHKDRDIVATTTDPREAARYEGIKSTYGGSLYNVFKMEDEPYDLPIPVPEAVSLPWLLNALAGMSFPEPGQAYDYIKRSLAAADVRSA